MDAELSRATPNAAVRMKRVGIATSLSRPRWSGMCKTAELSVGLP